MSKTNVEKVMNWRHRTKKKVVKAFGSKCGCCGYDKCHNALEFHHIDPNEKEPGWGSFQSHTRSWARIVVEMAKCVMICSNCHKECHAGIREIPPDIQRFDESLANDE
jgi:hypothetical protein